MNIEHVYDLFLLIHLQLKTGNLKRKNVIIVNNYKLKS